MGSIGSESVVFGRNKPGMAKVGAALMDQKAHRRELIFTFEKINSLVFFSGLKCKETAYAGIRSRYLSIR